MARYSDQDLRRAEFCHGPFSTRARPEWTDHEHRAEIAERMWFCDLGTLGCTEGHGDDWEVPYVEHNRQRIVAERMPPTLTRRIVTALAAAFSGARHAIGF